MAQDVRGHINFFLLRQPPIRLGGHAPDNRGGFTAGEPSAGACDKEGRGLILARLQLVLEDRARVPMPWHEIPDPATLGRHARPRQL